jgi:hypothetical protein
MRPIAPLLIFGLLATALTADAQLAQTPPPLSAVAPPCIGPVVSRLPVAPSVNADLAQRLADSAPIRATGPAQEPVLKLQAPGDVAAQTRIAPEALPLLDAAGQPLPGVIRIAPNRIFDPGSGRYYWTGGSGAAERIIP